MIAVSRFNYYNNQLSQINHSVLGALGSALIGHTEHMQEIINDETYYTDTNCKIIGKSIVNAT